jgi:hypothetical protein
MDHRIGTDPLDQLSDCGWVADVEPFVGRRTGRVEVGPDDGPARNRGAGGRSRTQMAGGPGDEDSSDHEDAPYRQAEGGDRPMPCGFVVAWSSGCGCQDDRVDLRLVRGAAGEVDGYRA